MSVHPNGDAATRRSLLSKHCETKLNRPGANGDQRLMADVSERSGDCTLDALINAYFADDCWYDDDDGDDEQPYLSRQELLEALDAEQERIQDEHGPDALVVPQTPFPARLRTLRDPSDAVANCGTVSRHFVAFLRAQQLIATTVDGKAHELYPELERSALRRGGAHTWVEVETDSATFAVDWTAAQYGRSEFPAVVRRSRAPA